MSEASSSFHQHGGLLAARPIGPSSCFHTCVKQTKIHTNARTHTLGSKELAKKGMCSRSREEKTSFISFSPLVVLAGCLSPFLRFSTSSQNTPSTSRNKLFAHAWVRWNSLAPNPERRVFSLSPSLFDRIANETFRNAERMELVWVCEKSDQMTSTFNFYLYESQYL